MLGVGLASKGSANAIHMPPSDLKCTVPSKTAQAKLASSRSSVEKGGWQTSSQTSTQNLETFTAGTDTNTSHAYGEKHRFSGQKLASALFFRPSTFKFRNSSSGGEEILVVPADDTASNTSTSISFTNSAYNLSLSSLASDFTLASWLSDASDSSVQKQDTSNWSASLLSGRDKGTSTSHSHVGGSIESLPTADSSVAKPKSRPSSGFQRRKGPFPLGSLMVSNNKMTRLRQQIHPELIAALDVQIFESVNPGLQEQPSKPIISDELPPPVAWPVNSTTVSCEKSVNSATAKIMIQAATLPTLIHFLASEGPADYDYQEDFLKTFTYFARSKDVGRLLIVRYVNASLSIAAHADKVSSLASQGANDYDHSSEPDLGDNSMEGIEVHDLVGGDEANAIFAQKRSDWDKAIQARVLGFFKRWLERRPEDFVATDESEEASLDLNALLRLFLETTVILNPSLRGFGRGVLEKLVTADATKNFSYLQLPPGLTDSIPTRPIDHNAPGHFIKPTTTSLTKPILPLNLDSLGKSRFSFPPSSSEVSLKTPQKIHSRSFSLTSSSSPSDTSSLPLSGNSPVHVVEELALLEHAAFQEIRLSELMNQTWLLPASVRDAEAPNLRRFILWFDNVAYGCATEVLRHSDIGIRGSTITALITAARHCLTLRAYNACFEIIAGLGLGPVRRLQKTWDVVPKKYRKEYATVAALVSSGDNHKVYRRRLAEDAAEKGTEGPWVPYLGVNLTDQVYAEDGNTTYLTPSAVESSLPLINFAKCRLLSRLLTVIVEAQRGTYKHASRPGVLQWITDRLAKPASEDELYRRSYELEPSALTKQRMGCSKKDEFYLDSIGSGKKKSPAGNVKVPDLETFRLLT